MQPPMAAENLNQKGDSTNVNSASTVWEISALVDVDQESDSTEPTEQP